MLDYKLLNIFTKYNCRFLLVVLFCVSINSYTFSQSLGNFSSSVAAATTAGVASGETTVATTARATGVMNIVDMGAMISVGAITAATTGAASTVTSSSFGSKSTLNEARKLVENKDYADAVIMYSELLANDSLNVTLIVESANALALCGFVEGALMRLDRIWTSGVFVKRDVIPLVQNVVLLSGSPTLNRIFNTAKMAENRALGMSSPESPETPVSDLFLKANFLVSSRQYFQAISIFDYLVKSKPDNLAFRLGFITALEKMGSNDVAKEMLTELITKQKIKNSDAETILVLENHLRTLGKTKRSNAINIFGTSQPQTMAYIGMMLAPSYSNISGKLGYFLSDSYNASLDISMNKISDVNSLNVGTTVYQRKNNFIYGLGLTFSSGQTKNIYYKLSAGYSIPNKNRTSSLDLFCDFNMGFTKDVPVMFGISIGKSFYFGKRK